jgi:hypothetical protein
VTQKTDWSKEAVLAVCFYVFTVPYDTFFGWAMKTISTPFDLRVNAQFIDQNGSRISGFPLMVELEGVAQKNLEAGELSDFSFTADPHALPTSTFTKGLTFHFTDDWRATLAEKGEAVELSPDTIKAFLQCHGGACHFEAQDHNPLKDLTFKIQRIEHVDEAQKAAYAKKLEKEAEAARAEAKRQQEEEQAEVERQKAEERRIARLRKDLSAELPFIYRSAG